MKRWISGILSVLLLFSMLPVEAFATDPIPEPETAEAVVSETVEETAAETEPEETAAETEPEETVTETVPEETAAETEPEETVTETVPEETAAETEPEETVSETEPEETVSETEPEETAAETVPAETVATAEQMAALLARTVEDEAILDSGTLGKNMTWSLTEDYVLRIEGSGAMPKLTANKRPWEAYRGEIVEVILTEGITSIAADAFSYLRALTAVSLPASLEEIGDSAFNQCKMLPVLILPENLQTIGSQAFYMCEKLNTALPEKLEYIGDNAFWCTALTQVMIPETVTYIGKSAFGRCTSVVKARCPVNGIKYGGGDVLWGNLKELTLYGNGPMEINWIAYGESNVGFIDPKEKLTVVTFEDGVTSIMDATFQSCGALKTVNWGSGMKKIGENAFHNCAMLETTLPYGLEYIGDDAFRYCNALKEINIPETVTYIGSNAFNNCKGVTKLRTPVNGVNRGQYDPFGELGSLQELTLYGNGDMEFGRASYIRTLKTVTIEPGVTSIINSAFQQCTNLETVNWGPDVKRIGDNAFGNCDKLQTSLPEGLESIGAQAFWACKSLEEVYIPESVTYIGESAFGWCTNVTKARCPVNGVEYGGGGTNWDNLQEISLYGNGPMEINWGIYCKKLTKVTIEPGVTSIINSAFQQCTNLETVNWGPDVKRIGDDAFGNCDKLQTSLPEGLESIGAQAFWACISLEEVYIPESVTYIGDGAFGWCTNVTKARCPANGLEYYGGANNWDNLQKLTLYGNGPMEYNWGGTNKKLITVTLEDGITSVVPTGFQGCTALETVNWSSNLQEIGYEAFKGCESLKTALPDTLVSIGEEAFNGCTALTEVNIPESVTYIGEAAFSGCTNVEKARCPVNGVEYGGGGNNWTNLQELTLYGNGPMEINWASLSPKLTVVTMEDGITSIIPSGFHNCKGLETVNWSSDLQEIGAEAFRGCVSLNVSLPEGLVSIGEEAFRGCTSLTEINIPESVTYIGQSSFYDCTNVEKARCPVNGVEYGGGGTNWENLQELFLYGSGPMEINWASLSPKLTAVTIEDGITTVIQNAFESCTALTTIHGAADVTYIGTEAFKNCGSLKVLHYLGTEEQLTGIVLEGGNDAFRNCAVVYEPRVGTLTSGISWEVRENTLTLSGSGVIPDFTDKNPAPWHTLRNRIRQLVLEGEITAIGSYAFAGCRLQGRLVIPGTVDRIGEGAFAGTELEWVTLPDGLETVSSKLFADCKALHRVDLPEGLCQIGEGAFARSGLTSMTIPASVTQIGENAFNSCKELKSLVLKALTLDFLPDSFTGCDRLETVYYAGSASDWAEGIRMNGSGLNTIAGAQILYDSNYIPLYGISLTDAAGNDITDSTIYVDLVTGNPFRINVNTLPEDAQVRLLRSSGNLNLVTRKHDSTGLTLFGKEAGTTRMKITAETADTQASAYVSVVVRRMIHSIGISGDHSGYAVLGKPMQLVASIEPVDPSVPQILWSVENGTGSATITEDGIVTGSSCGSVTVRASAQDGSGVVAEKVLEIIEYAAKITGSQEVVSKQSIQLQGELAPINLTNTTIQWSLKDAQDSAYATLKDGKFTAGYVSEAKTVTVVAEAADNSAKPAYWDVRIVPVPVGLNVAWNGKLVNGGTVTCDLNDLASTEGRIKLTASVLPADASAQVIWTHSDKKLDYATYVQDGNTLTIIPKGSKTGKVTLTVSSADNAKIKQTVNIVFAKLAGEISILNCPEQMCGGMTAKLTTNIQSDKSLTDKNVLWSLSEDSLAFASVSSTGSLTTKPVFEQVTIHLTAQAKAKPEVRKTVDIILCPSAQEVQIFREDKLLTKDQVIEADLAGAPISLKASILPAAAQQNGVWNSSKPSVATVDQEGKVTVCGKGTAVITYTAQDGSKKSSSIKINAGYWLKTIGLYCDGNIRELKAGASLQLKTNPKTESGDKPTLTTFLWSSSNPKAASVDAKGKVKAGNVTHRQHVIITAKAMDGSGVEESYPLDVVPSKAETLYLTLDGKEVTAGSVTHNGSFDRKDVLCVIPWLYDAATGVASQLENAKVSLSGKSVTAEVTQEGIRLTPVANGKTTVTVSKDKLSAKLTVTILQYVRDLAVESDTGSVLTAGKTMTLRAATNTDVTNRKVTWTSGDPTVATVSTAGKVTAKNVGKKTDVVIAAAAQDGSGKTASMTITVMPAATGVNILRNDQVVNGRVHTVDMNDNPVVQLSARVYPGGETGALQKVNWTSSSTKIATVNTDGLVTFKQPGKVTITATAADNSGKKNTVQLEIVRNVKDFMLPEQILAGGKSLSLDKLIVKAPSDTTTKKLSWEITGGTGENYASISSTGALKLQTLTAQKEVKVTVTALDSRGYSETFTIKAYPATTKVIIKNDTLTVKAGETLQMNAESLPVTAAGLYKWSVNSTKVATIDENGKLTGVKAGTVTVTCQANDGSGVKSTVKVKVLAP